MWLFVFGLASWTLSCVIFDCPRNPHRPTDTTNAVACLIKFWQWRRGESLSTAINQTQAPRTLTNHKPTSFLCRRLPGKGLHWQYNRSENLTTLDRKIEIACSMQHVFLQVLLPPMNIFTPQSTSVKPDATFPLSLCIPVQEWMCLTRIATSIESGRRCSTWLTNEGKCYESSTLLQTA
jgi:hypothetical protein